MQRTSIRFESRKCPRHVNPMELILDDPQPTASPIGWWCDDCRGAWSEEYFYFCAEQKAPTRALFGSFSFRCPHCASLDISHTCVIECCASHLCNSCRTGFDL